MCACAPRAPAARRNNQVHARLLFSTNYSAKKRRARARTRAHELRSLELNLTNERPLPAGSIICAPDARGSRAAAQAAPPAAARTHRPACLIEFAGAARRAKPIVIRIARVGVLSPVCASAGLTWVRPARLERPAARRVASN